MLYWIYIKFRRHQMLSLCSSNVDFLIMVEKIELIKKNNKTACIKRAIPTGGASNKDRAVSHNVDTRADR